GCTREEQERVHETGQKSRHLSRKPHFILHRVGCSRVEQEARVKTLDISLESPHFILRQAGACTRGEQKARVELNRNSDTIFEAKVERNNHRGTSFRAKVELKRNLDTSLEEKRGLKLNRNLDTSLEAQVGLNRNLDTNLEAKVEWNRNRDTSPEAKVELNLDTSLESPHFIDITSGGCTREEQERQEKQRRTGQTDFYAIDRRQSACGFQTSVATPLSIRHDVT
ncbi:hypothetical protein BaRGS_00023596, partial [Batillaria attramentaria]